MITARTFTLDAPLPSHQEISGVSELFTTKSADDQVNRLLQRSLLEDTAVQGAQLAILEEDLELPMVMEQDAVPYIAVSRRHRKDKTQELEINHTAPEPERPIAQLPSTNSAIEGPEQHWIEPEEDTTMFSYEPSVLRFEPTGIEAFYDPIQVTRILSFGFSLVLTWLHSRSRTLCVRRHLTRSSMIKLSPTILL